MIRRQNFFPTVLFDGFFDDVFAPAKPPVPNAPEAFRPMRTDVKETEAGFELDIELPGFKKEDVTAELKDGYMTIKASRNTEEEEKSDNGRIIRKERYSGSVSRSFYVGEDVTQEDIKAKISNGILNIFVPKKEPKAAIEEKKCIAIEG